MKVGSKLRVFIYDHAPPHLHDAEKAYFDCTPFSKAGIERWCEIVEPQDAQFFLCGQYHDKDAWLLHPNRFDYFAENSERHIFDIEGDWPQMEVPAWLAGSPISVVNLPWPGREKFRFAYTRPTFSKLFVQLAKFESSEFAPLKYRKMAFRGQRDMYGVREKVHDAVRNSGVESEFSFTDQWHGPTDTANPIVAEYRQFMLDHAFSLCIAGTGHTTARFFETCCFGRVPIVINDKAIFAEEHYDTSFAFHLPTTLGVEDMAEQLGKIFAIPDTEMLDRCAAARAYFNGPVREYFKDPTLYFLRQMRRDGLIEV